MFTHPVCYVNSISAELELLSSSWVGHSSEEAVKIQSIRPGTLLKMTMSSPVGPDSSVLAQPIPIPTLTVLPPSSDTESWSRSPSPRLVRPGRHGRFHHSSRTRSKKRSEEEQSCSPKRQWGKKTQVVVEGTVEKGQQRSPSPSPSVCSQVEGDEQGQGSPSQDLLLPPSRAWSRSPSPSRRSRWSLRSLLNRDSDWDSCRLVSWIHPK